MRRGFLLMLSALVAMCDGFSVGAGVAHRPAPVRPTVAQHAVMGLVKQVSADGPRTLAHREASLMTAMSACLPPFAGWRVTLRCAAYR